MNALTLLGRLAVVFVAFSVVGSAVALAGGLLTTPGVVLPSLVTLALVAAVVGWLTLTGIGGSQNTETTYW